jgi:hypothetical protein
MTSRERWLLAGVVLLAVLLPVLLLWQQVRYGDAQSAARQFVQLEERAEKGDPEGTALARQARPEVRNSLSRGDFPGALKRLASLNAEDHAPEAAARHGKELGVDALWPPGSPEREKARGVLRTLAQKQKSGYDVVPAQNALVRVAEAARAGQRKEALAAFEKVDPLVRNAPLRPGFTAPQPPAPLAAGPGAKPGAAPLPQASQAEVQQFVQFFQLFLPQFIRRAEGEQKRVLEHLQPFGYQYAEAYQQGKDLRPVVPILKKMTEAYKAKDNHAAEALLEQAKAALKAARPLPPEAKPAPQASSGAAPAPSPVPPTLPPAGAPGGAPTPPPAGAQVSAEKILLALDGIRKLPDADYQRRRPQITQFLAQALAGARGVPGAPGALPRPPSLGVGEPASLRIELGPLGELTGLKGQGKDLSGDAPAGGYALAVAGKGEVPLRGPVRSDGKTVTERVSGAAGLFLASYRQEGRDLVLEAVTRRDRPGEESALLLRIPLHAGGWRWQAGEQSQVMAVDEKRELLPDEGGKLAPLTLHGAGVQLVLTAPTAASVTWEAGANALVVRFPVGKDKGETKHTLRLSPG